MLNQKFVDIGYVNFGYFSPELSSNDEYPSYIKKNVDDAIEKIQSYQVRNSITFGFMADIHYSKTHNHNIRTKRLMNAYSEIKKRVNVDMLILGGDYTNDGHKNYKVTNYRELRAHLNNEPYLPVNGNHDDNSIWDLYINADVSTHHIPTEEMYTLFYNHLPKMGAEFDKKNPGLYYLYNDYTSKIRYICLDMSDIPYKTDENGKLIYTKQHTFALSQNQIDWLINEALVFDEDGWEVIVVSHNFIFPEDEGLNEGEARKLDVVNNILDAYKSGEEIDKKYYDGDFELNVKTSFNKIKKGNIIACFAGHHHADYIKKTKTGIPIIFTGSVIMYNYGVKRTDGDKSELLFDMVTIDRDKKIIHITRIGAEKDREVSYQ